MVSTVHFISKKNINLVYLLENAYETIIFVSYQKVLHETNFEQEVEHGNTLNFFNTFINDVLI